MSGPYYLAGKNADDSTTEEDIDDVLKTIRELRDNLDQIEDFETMYCAVHYPQLVTEVILF